MRIDPGFPGGPIRGRRVGRPIQGSSSASDASPEQSSRTESSISSETASLIASLHEIPEVRTEVVEEIRQRLKRGDFLTREAAEKTAQAILDDLASFMGA